MTPLQTFIEQSIENHLLNIEDNNYYKLEKIIGRKRLEKLSFYLESNQEDKFLILFNQIIEERKTEEQIEKLLESEPPQEEIEKGMNPEGRTCRLFYGTNREPNDIYDISQGYGNERATNIHFGACEVHIPKSHNIGELSGTFWEKLIHFDFSHGAVQLKTLQPLDVESFWSEISNLLDPLEEEQKQALIFIHGFNTSFEEASIRTAQLFVDLNHEGVASFFAWASQAKALRYLSDEATIQYTEKHLTEFLTDFSRKSGANRIDIIAHSMGNRALLEAINRISKNTPEIQFGQIILAAPDVDTDVFKELAEAYSSVSEQTTLYVSNKDKAVGVSKWLHSHARAGFTPPVCVVPNINTVQVESSVKLLELGHGYFAEQKTLLSDIYQLLQLNLDANNREYLLTQKVNEIDKYWKLKSDG